MGVMVVILLGVVVEVLVVGEVIVVEVLVVGEVIDSHAVISSGIDNTVNESE